MASNAEKGRLIEKMFDVALKRKLNQLARKHDYAVVFELWKALAKNGCVKAYFCQWRWEPNATFQEAIDCLDDYFIGLAALLEKRQAAKERKQEDGDRELGQELKME